VRHSIPPSRFATYHPLHDGPSADVHAGTDRSNGEEVSMIDASSQQKVLELVFARADALNGYWNLYIAVTLGLIGLMASAKPFTEKMTIKILLSIAFAAFAYSNVDVLDATNEQRRQLLLLLKDSVYLPAALPAGPPERYLLWLFHIAMDVLTLLAIWLVPWHQLRGKADEG